MMDTLTNGNKWFAAEVLAVEPYLSAPAGFRAGTTVHVKRADGSGIIVFAHDTSTVAELTTAQAADCLHLLGRQTKDAFQGVLDELFAKATVAPITTKVVEGKC